MHNDMLSQIPSPCYVLEEARLRRNLQLIRSVKEAAGVNIILAFKAYALWKSFPIIREYIPCSTASSIHEARLAFEEMGSPAHTYSPAYTERDFPAILRYSSHITFNSLSQFEHFYPQVVADGNRVSCGLRINPEYSEVETDLYNPCAPGSRLGITADKLAHLPQGVEGLHFHTLCESTSYDLEKTLVRVEERFGHLLPQVKWLNMGGGHLMTRQGYATWYDSCATSSNATPTSRSYSSPAAHSAGRRARWYRPWSTSSRTTAYTPPYSTYPLPATCPTVSRCPTSPPSAAPSPLRPPACTPTAWAATRA